MIDVTMTSPDGVTLDTAGKYCSNYVRVSPILQEKAVSPGEMPQIVTPDPGMAGLSRVVVPAFPNFRRFTGEVVSKVVGSGARVLLVTDPSIAAHYEDDTFSALVKFEMAEPTAYSIVSSVGYNSPDLRCRELAVFPGTTFKQHQLRYDGNGTLDSNTCDMAIKDDGGATAVGYLLAYSSGELYIHSRSNNYAIQPGTYTVEIKW